MKTIDIIKTANSNLLRNKSRAFLTILAIFIGTFTIIVTQGINTGVKGYINKQLDSAGGTTYLEIMPSATMEMMQGLMSGGNNVVEYNPDKNSSAMQMISPEDLEKIKKIDGIIPSSVKAYTTTDVEYISSKKTDKKYIANVNILPSDTINIDMSNGKKVNVASAQPQISLLPGYAVALGFENDEAAVGQTVILTVKRSAIGDFADVEAVVSGIQNASVVSMGRSWINDALHNELFAQIMKGVPEQIANQTYFATAEFEESANLDHIKESMKELGFEATTIKDQIGMMITFFDAITTVLTIFGVIALIAASIGIINTLYMAVQERTREIGLMKAMGLGRGKIFTIFSFEAIALGFWGAILGIIMAFIGRSIVNQLASDTFLKGLPGFTLIEFTATSLIGITIIIMLIAFLAGSLPARKAAKKDPIDALRYE